MKANKWIVAMTAGVMAIGILSGCGNSDTPSGQNREPQSAAAVQEEKRTKASETGGNGGETEGALEERMRPREEKHWLSIILQADTQKMWRM